MLIHHFCPDWATWLFQGIPGLFWENLCEAHQVECNFYIPRLLKQKKTTLSEIPSTSDSIPMLAAKDLDK
jgi:hypothetical protein